MKSRRILQIVLLVMVVVFLGVAGFLYAANSREVNRQHDTTDAIAKNQAILVQGIAQKAAKQKEASDLAAQLASAKSSLAQVNFPVSAESIEYDKILLSIAGNAKVQVTNLTATQPTDIKENNINYQGTTFTITVQGQTPGTIFATPDDSTKYISSAMKSILAYINGIATGNDFRSSAIQSVSITAPQPMTDKQISDLNNAVNGLVRAGLTTADIQNLTEDQIAALVQSKLAAMNPAQIQLLLDQAGLAKPSAVITIQVWTRKGA